MSDRDEIWKDCSSSKCALIDKVGFSICRHTFKMAATTLKSAPPSEWSWGISLVPEHQRSASSSSIGR